MDFVYDGVILWVYPHWYGLRFPTKNADQQFPDKPVSVRLLEEQSPALTAQIQQHEHLPR